MVEKIILPSDWISVEMAMPLAGDYHVKINRNNAVLETKKRLIVRNGQAKWFGGCRPFSDNDIVLAWKISEEANVI